jgi:hypothetical protein
MDAHEQRMAELIRRAFPEENPNVQLVELLVAFGLLELIAVTIGAMCGY